MSHIEKPPKKLILHKVSRNLEIIFADDTRALLPAAFLRAESLSAENRHADVPQKTFSGVGILSIEPVGHYAVKLLFSDGHRSGIYSWETLRSLGNVING